MNYYERYCGDYARDTAHLSLGEHGAYTLMLDAYYSTERALPADYPALYRLCRAMSPAERAGVRTVADEFFGVAEDGLRHNTRADKDLLKALKRIELARANGRKHASGIPSGILDLEPGGIPAGPHMVKPPDPRPHAPKDKTKAVQETGARKANGHGSRLPDDWCLPDDWAAWALVVRPDWTPQGVIRESLTFRDYWTAKAGKDGVKLNWLATWRNWIRRAEMEPRR